jgi:hypothetical protein
MIATAYLDLCAHPAAQRAAEGPTLARELEQLLNRNVKFDADSLSRNPDRTLVTVPNGQFSSMTLENLSRRDEIWFHPRLSLSRDTSPAQIRKLLDSIEDSGEAERCFRREAERHSGMNPNTLGAIATLAIRFCEKCSASLRKNRPKRSEEESRSEERGVGKGRHGVNPKSETAS